VLTIFGLTRTWAERCGHLSAGSGGPHPNQMGCLLFLSDSAPGVRRDGERAGRAGAANGQERDWADRGEGWDRDRPKKRGGRGGGGEGKNRG